MNDGWTKTYRKSMDDPLYFAEPFTRWQAFQDLILIAKYKPSYKFVRGIKVDVGVGEIDESRDTLAKRWKWSRGKVERFLEFLETDGKIEQQKSTVICLISIVNYCKYQQSDTTDRATNDTTDRATNGQQIEQQTEQLYTKEGQERKESKERKEDNLSINSLSFVDASTEKNDEQPAAAQKKEKPTKESTKKRTWCHDSFDDIYNGFTHEKFVWDRSESVCLLEMLGKLVMKMEEQRIVVTDVSKRNAFEGFLMKLWENGGDFVHANFSPHVINTKFNDFYLIAKGYKNGKSKPTTNDYGVSDEYILQVASELGS